MKQTGDDMPDPREWAQKHFPVRHYTCEDLWYSCALAEDGNGGRTLAGTCDCGAEDAHEEAVEALREFRRACYLHAASVAFTEGVEYPIATIGHFSPADAAQWHMLHTRREIADELVRLAAEIEGKQ